MISSASCVYLRRLVAAFALFSSIAVHAQDLAARSPLDNWASFHGDLSGRRTTSLSEITRDNVSRMQLQWVFHSRNSSVAGAAPIVVDGVMYVATAGDAYAIDGRTGAMLWRHSRQSGASAAESGPPHTNHAAALLGNKLYIATDDAHLLCLDARSGNFLWEVSYADATQFYGPPSAPLAIGDKVVVGVSGNQQQERGFIAAFKAADGKEAWRFRIEAAPGASCGSAVWMPGTYDPNQNAIYWGVGSPVAANQSAPPDDSNHAGCFLALDAGTGKLKWLSKLSPLDACSGGAPQVPVVIDTTYKGSARKLIMMANASGSVDVIDRETGKLLSEPAKTCHGSATEAGWSAPSYAEETRLFYFPSDDDSKVEPAAKRAATVRAYDAAHETFAWKDGVAERTSASSGLLTTSTGLLLLSDGSHSFSAADAATGKLLWRFNMGQSPASPPISYAIEGKQYFVVAAGKDLFVFALP